MAESPVACLAAVHTTAMHNVLALGFHSVDVPWWADMVLKNGFIMAFNKPYCLTPDSISEIAE